MPAAFGTLTLNANGSYSYDGNPNVVPPAGATDVFVYTIKDGDGDTSTTTLTITLTDSGIIAPNDSDVTVNENALDTTALPDGSDLAVGTVTGSLPGSAAETDATNQLNGSGGTAPLTYALVSGGNAATAGTFGTIQVNANGSYVYTLTKPFDTSPDADNGANTEVAESFSYGRPTPTATPRPAPSRSTSSTTYRRRMPTPTAWLRARIVTGNVLTDGTADVFGADGATTTVPAGGVVGFKAGNDTSVPVLTGIGTPIAPMLPICAPQQRMAMQTAGSGARRAAVLRCADLLRGTCVSVVLRAAPSSISVALVGDHAGVKLVPPPMRRARSPALGRGFVVPEVSADRQLWRGREMLDDD